MEYCEKCGYIIPQCECEKPKTNADRIRSMTDEELAEFLESYVVCKHCEHLRNDLCTFGNPCTHGFAMAMALKWLQEDSGV